MSISNTTEQAVMLLIFNATAWANYADNAASSPQTTMALALHTADPADAGDMSTSEIAYTSYARASVNRASGAGGWSVASGTATLVTATAFAAGTGGSGTATHFSVGKTGGGAAAILFSGTVTPNIVCGNGVTPNLTTSTTCSLD
jgi:hypothetical protein